MAKSYRFKLLGAKDSDIEGLTDILLEDERIGRVAVGDYMDGYSVSVRFIDDKEPRDALVYLSRIIPKRFGTPDAKPARQPSAQK